MCSDRKERQASITWKGREGHSTAFSCVSPDQCYTECSALWVLCALPLQSPGVSSSAPYTHRWMPIHMAADRSWAIPSPPLFSNEWRSSLICCLVHSGSISLCSNSCTKFRRGVWAATASDTTKPAVFLMAFFWFRKEQCWCILHHSSSSVRCKNTLQLKSLELKAYTVSKSPFSL